MTERLLPLSTTLLAALALGMVACGSVSKSRPDDAGATGTGGQVVTDAGAGGRSGTGGATTGTGGGGGGTGTGGSSGAGGTTVSGSGGGGGAAVVTGTGGSSGILLRGGLEAVGPAGASTVSNVRLIRSGLTYPRASNCNAAICISGGIAP